MKKINTFIFRLKRKVSEHLSTDPSGVSLCRYVLRYFKSKVVNFFRKQYYRRAVQYDMLDENKVNVAVRITGGMGDLVVCRRFIQALAAECPNTCFLIFVPSVPAGKWVFENMPRCAGVFYDGALDFFRMNLCDSTMFFNNFAFISEEYCNAAKICRIEPFLFSVIAKVKKNIALWRPFLDNHPVLDGAFARQVIAIGENRYSFIPRKLLQIPVPPFALDLVMDEDKAEELTGDFKKYITLNTGFDQNFVVVSDTVTKSYPLEYFNELTALIKKNFPEIAIVQIGSSNSKSVQGTDLDLVGKTTLPECAAILKGSQLHIDCEGGLVHVAASIGTRCAVLFGPTSMDFFAYPGNINIKSGKCHDCWWATERWMEICPRKLKRNECMYALTPQLVFETIAPELQKISGN